ncbi:MAG: 4-hydroxy-tetrahydrodipicolinate reductase [Myxococcales bacterium]|nr:4-hydroxy-tetrahydrodipicolinate reductase [Myxococcales bacterium]
MGRLIQASLPAHPGLTLAAAHGRDPGDFAGCDVVIDVAVASATDDLLARLDGAALVTGVTGRDAAQQAAIHAYAERAPVLVAANFSVGVAVLRALARQAARALGPAFQAEIFEIHHRHKADAPSGTALALGAAVAEGAGLPWPDAAATARAGRRGDAEIGLSAARGGDVVGEHTVFFLGPAERLELTHRATDRAVFAHGALRAAAWIAGRASGIYGVDAWLDDALRATAWPSASGV